MKGATVACLNTPSGPATTVPVSTTNEIAQIHATVSPSASPGFLTVAFSNTLGVPPVLNRFTVAGTSVTPILTGALIEVGGVVATQFLRGDVTGDGALTIGDPVTLVGYLFSGETAPGCLMASDANGDGALIIDDVIYLLSYQFSDGPEPPPPFPTCGSDPMGNSLTCETTPDCP